MTYLSGGARLQQSDSNQERKTWEPQSINQKVDNSIIRLGQWSSDVNVQDVSGLVDVPNSPKNSLWTLRGKTTLAQNDSWSSARIVSDF